MQSVEIFQETLSAHYVNTRTGEYSVRSSSRGAQPDAELRTPDPAIPATELFAQFTANIIQENTLFTR